MKLKQHRKSLSCNTENHWVGTGEAEKTKHELETVHKEKQKITNELEEKVVKKAKSKWKVSFK